MVTSRPLLQTLKTQLTSARTSHFRTASFLIKSPITKPTLLNIFWESALIQALSGMFDSVAHGAMFPLAV